MINLNEWISRNAIRPLIWLMIISLCTQLLYFGYLTYNRYSNQLNRIDQSLEFISLGVQQSNRPLIDSDMTSLFGNSEVAVVALCSGSVVSISYPPLGKDYCFHLAHNLKRWSIRRSLIGNQGLDLVVVISPLIVFGPLLFLMFITIVMLTGVIWTMSRMRKRLDFEVLKPLCEGLTSESPLNISELEELRLKNLEHIELVRKFAVSKAMSDLSTQVAHDIRSPLTALDSVLGKMEKLPEKQRIMVRHAVNRIRDIANNLLEKNRQLPEDSSSKEAVVSASIEPANNYLLSSLIDPIITEKHFQFRSKTNIEIIAQLDKTSYGLFAKIQPIEFRRLVSNLINNAVEALGKKGEVEVFVRGKEDKVIIEIKDNGKGIAPEILEKLGRKGETHGKDGGSGLGLYHAKTTVESWNGKLELRSEEGKGTSVILTLPKTKAPDWFVSKLEIETKTVIVTLDDDISIHHIWQGRYESIKAKEQDIEIHHFSAPDEFREWIKNNQSIIKKTLFLLDYELAGYQDTGLSLAEEMKIGQQTILVTSRYEEQKIIDKCMRLKAGMIPKGLVSLVPINIITEKNKSITSVLASSGKLAVLIDDDALVRMNWEDAASAAGIDLKVFDKPDGFLSNLESFSKDIPIYIDSELGENIRGENIALDLREKGFTDITLETGHSSERFSHLPWLKIMDKESPW